MCVYVPFCARLGLYPQKTCPVLSMHVPVQARLGLYALKTCLYDPERVCIFILEPI